MKLLKSLACVLLTSAAMLSASGFDRSDLEEGKETSLADTQSHATAIGTDTFQITSNEVASVVLSTLSQAANEAGNERMASVFSSLLGENAETILSGLKGVTFTISVEDTAENLVTDVPGVNVITFLSDTTTALVTFLETSGGAPATWYTSASSLVPTSEATEGATVWGISPIQSGVFTLARLVNELTHSYSEDMSSSMVERTIRVHELLAFKTAAVYEILTAETTFLHHTGDAHAIGEAEAVKHSLIETLRAISFNEISDESVAGIDRLNSTVGRGRLISTDDREGADLSNATQKLTIEEEGV